MNIPIDQIESLKKRGFSVNEETVVMHGKTRLTVAFDGWTFSKDLSTAIPIFKVTKVEKPEPKHRKSQSSALASAKAKK